jgi:hypothetical protein
MWIVDLITKVKQNHYREDHFPRIFKYQVDALRLVEEVKRNGGRATAQRIAC